MGKCLWLLFLSLTLPLPKGEGKTEAKCSTYKLNPALWFLAMDGDEIAGISLCRERAFDNPEVGWVNTLGVRRPWRKRGIGLALLRHSFSELYRRGKRMAGLGVDAENLTGALRLYERAGMRVHSVFDRFEKEIRPGREISVQSL